MKAISGFTNSSYDYDANGNLKSDSQKNITLGYNFLNLPQTVSGSQNLSYTYSAVGKNRAEELLPIMWMVFNIPMEASILSRQKRELRVTVMAVTATNITLVII
ncbi:MULTISPECIES: hypothetical protein [unclassified Pedobacter]|uniref:hypothetical protein n=1 Tax=unclassified Pedobacter TaxID=2628915 RepID=UPI001E31AF5E|nr:MULTISPECIES: hypothetical protein [unclassified Pedobacter]